MTNKLIYLDNAATTYPKPENVYAAQDAYSRSTGNAGRGAHRLALESARMQFETRQNAAGLLGIKNAERLVFTPGCTYSINMALKGWPWRENDIVLVGALEHNAVMRPLRQLEQEFGIRVITVPYASKNILDLHALIKLMLEHKPGLCVFSEASNVTGETIDTVAVAAICGAHKVPLMVDAAQTAGRSLYKLDGSGISVWCASTHKGLFGTQGLGLLYVAPNVDLTPIISGGTGSRSEEYEMPAEYPDRLEPGTPNGPAIAALGAGVEFLKEKGIENVWTKERKLTERFLDWAQRSGKVRVYGNRYEVPGTAVVAFDMPGVAGDRLADKLDADHGIAVRSGLHCAAAAHNTLGTTQSGLVRVSFSYFNNGDEVDALTTALEFISKL